jgi:predicted TIM-barrel fold metal-dependent hydrolase
MSIAITGVDCHAHIFDPDLPLAFEPGFVPQPNEMGTVGNYLAVLDAHGLSHGVLVSSMCYGTDNTALLDAIAVGSGRLLGIAIVDASLSRTDLERLATAGVVGIRFNVSPHGVGLLTAPGMDNVFKVARERGWFVQINAKNDDYIDLLPVLERSGCTIILDHCARPDLSQGVQGRGFQAALELGRRGIGVAKLSGAYHFSKAEYPYEDATPYVGALIEAFGIDNCVWGSDWPFVRMTARLDYGPQRAMLNHWVPDAADRLKILITNPARLFGLGQPVD